MEEEVESAYDVQNETETPAVMQNPPQGDTAQSAGGVVVKRNMKSKKRAITLLIKTLSNIIHSLERVSRTMIILDRRALNQTIQELRDIVNSDIESGLDEQEQESVDIYLLEEEQRVRDICAKVQYHLEANAELRQAQVGCMKEIYGVQENGMVFTNAANEMEFEIGNDNSRADARESVESLTDTWNNFVRSCPHPLETQQKDFFASEKYGGETQDVERGGLNLEERYVAKLVEETTRKLPDQPGYEVALPWILGLPKPRNNRYIAEQRFLGLERRFIRDPDLKSDYCRAMNKTIRSNYAFEICDEEELQIDDQFYLPHHGVRKKDGKDVRLVMDSFAKFKGRSLNDCLLSVPALQNDMMDVLLRFRENKVAVCADIEAMFSRISVCKEDARFDRFLCRESPEEPIKVYQMKGVVFGDSSSPCLAINTLLRTVRDVPCSEHVRESVRSQFYVNDYLDSYEDEETAARICMEIRETLKNGNFNLRGWRSNSSEVFKALGFWEGVDLGWN